jgi:hypothetical protein
VPWYVWPGGWSPTPVARYKAVGFFGYALSALCKLGLLLAAWAPIAALLMVDRLGKGIRTALWELHECRATLRS